MADNGYGREKITDSVRRGEMEEVPIGTLKSWNGGSTSTVEPAVAF